MAAFQPSRSGAPHEQPNSDAAHDRREPNAFKRDEDGGEHDQQPGVTPFQGQAGEEGWLYKINHRFVQIVEGPKTASASA
jgi:hypothetical protein